MECANLFERPPDEECWNCPTCTLHGLKEEAVIPSEICFKCHEVITLEQKVLIENVNARNKEMVEVYGNNSYRQCEHCRNWFHRFCFRPIGINCLQCHIYLLK